MRDYTALSIALATFGLAVLVTGQGTDIEFGRTGGGTQFTGKADTVTQDGPVHTCLGRVTMSFATSSLVLHADDVTYDIDAKGLVAQGTAHLKLDSK